MRALFKLAASKLNSCKKASFFQALSVFISVGAAAFFLNTTAILNSASLSQSGSDAASLISSFIKEVFSYFAAGGIIVTLLCGISVTVFLKMRAEEEKSFYAILSSIGADRLQRATISLITSALIYLFPILSSSLLGTILGDSFARSFAESLGLELKHVPNSILVALIVSTFAIILVVICTLTVTRADRSLIQQLRRHNSAEAQAYHSYRNSYTYRSMAAEKRIAKQSVEYYKPTYRRISLMFTATAVYPILCILFFGLISKVKIVADTNPYDGIDTSAAVTSGVMITVALCTAVFAILCVFGILQIISMIKAQSKLRQVTLSVYKSIGMTENGIRRVLMYEYRTVAFHSFIAIIVISILLFSLLL